MLTDQPIRYSVAVASPRDTRSLVPAIDRSRGPAPGSLSLPQSAAPIRATAAWSEPARHDWVASRLAAKRAATALLRRSTIVSTDIEIVRDGRNTRPGTQVLARRIAARTPTRQISIPLSLSISLSHVNGYAIAAAAQHPVRIGVDLERQGRVSSKHADYFLSARERRQQPFLSLTELWALKESAWKALGCADSTPFAELELVFDGNGRVRAVRLGGMVIPAIAEVRRPWEGWVAAVLVFMGVTD